jgi:hypothetical protein
MRLPLLLGGACFCLLAACGGASPQGVRHYGSLHAIMHDGDRGPHVDLASVMQSPRVIAVGALSEMRGEITIVDGEAWLSYGTAEGTVQARRATSTDEHATLLVVTEVASWTAPRTFENDVPLAELDARIEALARASGVDVGRPFAVRIEGELADLSAHILRGAGHGRTTLTRESAQARVVGFFSRGDQGVFTHMGSFTHLHVLLDADITAHVDGIVIRAGATIAFGAAERAS